MFAFFALCLGWAAATAHAREPTAAERAAFVAWREQYVKTAIDNGHSLATVRRMLDPLAPDPRVLSRARPPIPPASAAMIADGKRALAANRAALAQISARYGVEREVIVAVWGMQARYGKAPLEYDSLTVLATLASASARRENYENNIDALIGLVEGGVLKAGRLASDSAGALGQPRLMPEKFYENAVDGDRNGTADIWASAPDILASIATFLVNSGWQAGQPIFIEAFGAPANAANSDPQTLSAWGRLGVRAANGAPMAGARRARLVFPDGPAGPAILAFANFDVLRKVNDSSRYALTAALLARGVAGGGATLRPFAPQAAALATPPAADTGGETEQAFVYIPAPKPRPGAQACVPATPLAPARGDCR
ncbi:MAG: lytic transglycosylase domain-containing protein [Hyphomonadaceae bacterium]